MTKNVNSYRKDIKSHDSVVEILRDSPALRGKGINTRKGLRKKKPSSPVGNVSLIESAVGLVSSRVLPVSKMLEN